MALMYTKQSLTRHLKKAVVLSDAEQDCISQLEDQYSSNNIHSKRQ